MSNPNKKILQQLHELKQMGEEMSRKAYSAIVALERVHAPAPEGGKERRVFSVAKEQEMRTKFRNRLLKKRAS